MFLKFLTFFLLVPAIILAESFTVSEFSTTDEGEANSFIEGEFSEGLANATPGDVRTGKWVLRQKYEDPFEDISYYQLYLGKQGAESSGLKRFEAPSGVSYDKLVSAKFYVSSDAESDEDVEMVYFDGSAIYLEDEEELYIQSAGTMLQLKASVTKPSVVKLSSTPDAAEVYLNGVNKGLTPVEFSVKSPKPFMVQIKKTGHYPLFKAINPVAGETVSEAISLNKSTALVDHSVKLATRLMDLESRGNQSDFEVLESDIKKTLEEHPAKVAATRSDLLQNYPKNPSQLESEEEDDFSKRTEGWNADRQRATDAISSDSSSYALKLEALLGKTEQAKVNAPAGNENAIATSEPTDSDDAVKSADSDEESDIEEDSGYQVDQDMQDEYAIDDSMDDITNRFGYSDDIKHYSGITLAVLGVGLAAMAGVEVSNALSAQSAVDSYSNDERQLLIEEADASGVQVNQAKWAIQQFDQQKSANEDAVSTHWARTTYWGLGAISLWTSSLFLIRF
jgi:hypothetical protein